ncbi:tumor necrosis factor receptor superfamily member 10C-like [Haliotis asinina]|uniref:tumor necrosis factor receptor superfamily member 10C-like n=1 Tax=Haliotis asinina TaxID=109174 RepID=UPI0035323660
MSCCSSSSESALTIILIMVDAMSTTLGQNSPPCPRGQYYDFSSQDHSSCKLCTYCPPGSEVTSPCTNQSNTVCKSCDYGTYSSGGYKCQNCSRCPPGTFVSRQCTLTSDTQCEPCAKGMYSSDWSAEFCIPCSRCGKAVTVERNCSDTHDYKCGECIEGYYRHPNLPSTCIKCSYCYPNHTEVTVVVNECLTKSKDPNMMCMPVVGGPLPKGTFSSSSGSTTRTGSASTVPTSTPSPSSQSWADPLTLIIITAASFALLVIIFSIFVFSIYCKHGKGNRMNIVTLLYCMCTKNKRHTRETKMTSGLSLLKGNEPEQSASKMAGVYFADS